ncbi:hypothetical protein H2200_008930 [Cladophialophora chaetospira]|uniref:Tat pathway signal sequence n=1 Tax=Cladophialophora chaetospira TaxID=386627 RepID=A0AA38X4X4_9EURO|nr:hypothetical protein H2200_008930 [Cladophialophora chaetospira]
MKDHSMRNALLRPVSHDSPLLNLLDISLTEKQMNASLIPGTSPSIFRLGPSPEVDKAWQRIGDIRPVAITRDDVVKLGKDAELAIKYPASFGFGDDAYIGRLDVLHQIHCLDALRREANFDYYYRSTWPDGLESATQLHRLHLTHCTYLLLENIMCNANLEVYTHFWYRDTNGPFADFNVNKKCRDFDAILDWQNRNAVEMELYNTIENPGLGEWMSPELRAVFDEEWNTFHNDATGAAGQKNGAHDHGG